MPEFSQTLIILLILFNPVTESYLHHGKIIKIVKDVKTGGRLNKHINKIYKSYFLDHLFSGTGITCRAVYIDLMEDPLQLHHNNALTRFWFNKMNDT